MIGLWRILLYGVQGFRRNVWLSIIAIITMTMTLTTITIFVLGNLVASKQYQEFNKKIDYVVFIFDNASDADIESLNQQIKNRPEVASSQLFSKEEVRLKFEEQFKKNESLKGIVTPDNNPLPREVDLKFYDPQQIDSFDKFVRQSKFEKIIENTTYQTNKSSIDNYIRSTNLLKIFGIVFTSFFTFIAFLVILNTIRLAIFSRREEIEIMRLVGATRGYIRGPFLVEGVLFGLVGALFSAILFWGLLRQLQIVLLDSVKYGTTNFINDLFSSSLKTVTTQSGFNTLFSQLLLIQVGVGIFLGIFCSYMAVRRYLRE